MPSGWLDAPPPNRTETLNSRQPFRVIMHQLRACVPEEPSCEGTS
jgi:hypothetical protein